jgi:hypothetical protein
VKAAEWLTAACAALIVAVIVWWAVGHQSGPTDRPSPSASPPPIASQIRVTPAGKPAPSNAPTVAALAVTPGRGVITVDGNEQPVIVRQQTPAIRVVSRSPAGRETVIAPTVPGRMETATVPAANDSDGAAMVVTSTPDPVQIVITEPEHSGVGVIGGLMPGWVALDVQLVRGRPLTPIGLDLEMSLDAEVGPGQAGAGVAVGSKYFVTGGGCVEWSGRPGWYVAAGVRF